MNPSYPYDAELHQPGSVAAAGTCSQHARTAPSAGPARASRWCPSRTATDAGSRGARWRSSSSSSGARSSPSGRAREASGAVARLVPVPVDTRVVATSGHESTADPAGEDVGRVLVVDPHQLGFGHVCSRLGHEFHGSPRRRSTTSVVLGQRSCSRRSLMAAMSDGPLPQQPPTRRAPAATHPFTRSRSSGSP